MKFYIITPGQVYKKKLQSVYQQVAFSEGNDITRTLEGFRWTVMSKENSMNCCKLITSKVALIHQQSQKPLWSMTISILPQKPYLSEQKIAIHRSEIWHEVALTDLALLWSCIQIMVFILLQTFVKILQNISQISTVFNCQRSVYSKSVGTTIEYLSIWCQCTAMETKLNAICISIIMLCWSIQE